MFIHDKAGSFLWVNNHIDGVWYSQPHGPAQELYAEDRRIWNAIFEMVVRDLAMCERDGVEVNGSKIYPIVLGNKGDWSYLVALCAIQVFYENGIRFWFGGRRIE